MEATVVDLIIEIVKYIVFIITTFFFMQVITDKDKKVSIVGTLLVCASSIIAYRGVINAILCGEAIVISVNQFITNKKSIIKMLCICVIGLAIGFYHNGLHYEWMGLEILVAPIYIAIIVWTIWKNKKDFKFEKQDMVYTIIGVIIGAVLCYFGLRYYSYLHIVQTIPDDVQGNGLTHLMSYGYSMFLPFFETENNLVYSSFISIFPLSLIVAMLYVYKKEKHVEFLMPMIIILVLESVFCMTRNGLFNIIDSTSEPFPMLYVQLCANAVNLGCIYMYMYMIANIDENIFSITTSMRIVLALIVFYFFIPRPEVFTSKGFLYGITAVITLLYFLFINFADPRYKKVLLWVLSIWALISSVPVLFI